MLDDKQNPLHEEFNILRRCRNGILLLSAVQVVLEDLNIIIIVIMNCIVVSIICGSNIEKSDEIVIAEECQHPQTACYLNEDLLVDMNEIFFFFLLSP